jgi:hypothetical protein
MYHAFVKSCGMKEDIMNIKTVGKSGQISLGKALAGMNYIMEIHGDGDIVLKRALVIPANERVFHEPAMKKKLARADDWMHKNPANKTNLVVLETRLKRKA